MSDKYIIYPHDINGEKIIWSERKTCFVSENPQRGKVWTALRAGRITMSYISEIVGRKGKNKLDSKESELLAKIIVGTEKRVEDEKSRRLMDNGNIMESIIRDWLSQREQRKIVEVGLAVWKEDMRFGGSLDGEFIDSSVSLETGSNGEKITVTESNEGLEIKAPEYLYTSLIEHVQQLNMGIKMNEGYVGHIFNAHYDQMIGNGVITGKKYMKYVVASTTNKLSYIERIEVKREHWDNVLYPAAVKFYDEYIVPELIRSNIKRIDPVSKETENTIKFPGV